MFKGLFLLSAWVQGLGERFFAWLLHVTAQKAAADLTAASIDARRRTMAAAMEALDYAKSLNGQGDEVKKKIIDEFTADIADIAAITRDVFSGAISPAAGQETLEGAPFESPPSGSISASRPPPSVAPAPAALTDQSAADESTPAPRRRRGRPPKYPNPNPQTTTTPPTESSSTS
jgi:hypothetical protein